MSQNSHFDSFAAVVRRTSHAMSNIEIYEALGTLSQGSHEIVTSYLGGAPIDDLARNQEPPVRQSDIRNTLGNAALEIATNHLVGRLHAETQPVNQQGTVPCAEDPDLFFAQDRVQIKLAKALCGTCELIEQCRDEAIDQGDKTTIRGGLTPKERDSFKRRRTR